MDFHADDQDAHVRLEAAEGMLHIRLDRQEALNSLSLPMVRRLATVLEAARGEEGVRLVVITGSGPKAFCAGGDIKKVALLVRQGDRAEAEAFFREEYALDFSIHRFPKPVVVIAHGVTMGGGLGLAAGADVVVATETTHMAMPETRIGFFPDVGATAWLYDKCPPGYPEYLALTGDDVLGAHAVRLGLATHFVETSRVPNLVQALIDAAPKLPRKRHEAARRLHQIVSPFQTEAPLPHDPEMDAWVATYFDGVSSVPKLLEELSQCQVQSRLCDGVFRRLSERSPTAVALTLALLKRQRGRPLEEVFALDARAACWMIGHHDFWEGVRARLIDKDNQPRWNPARFDQAVSFGELEPFLRDEGEKGRADGKS
ncbi:MAG: enoyl-CoA hydratase/isomerase family protein [Desulfosoma sp.]